MDLAQRLELLLGDFSHLTARIKHLNYETDACGERINVRCSYMAFRQGQPTFDDFIDVIASHVVPFCLPRREIREAQIAIGAGDHVKAGRLMNELSEKARSLFIKAKQGSHRSGEAGEIVLYLLTEWLLQAPQIVSKMYLKTNNQMPVHGTDGIHIRYDNDTEKLCLYWGESKAHASLSSALSSALDSIKEFLTNGHEKREIDIITSYADLDGVGPECFEAILRYLDPYAEESNERRVIHSCLLVFDFPLSASGQDKQLEESFVAQANEAAGKFIHGIKKTVEDKGLGPQRFEFFLLPVPSVQEFRDKFQAKIGWPND